MWWLLYLIPKNWLSRMVGHLVSIVWPWPLRLIFLRWFAARYKISLSEAERPLSDYKSIQDFFTRRLKPGVRPIGNAPVVHPADGELTVAERVTGNLSVQVKGIQYKVSALLGESTLPSELDEGVALTYYLCPTDYHRVHSPVDGVITEVHYVPGALWPVNSWSVKTVRGLFVRNERVIVWIRTAYGPVALVMVGATNVGKMSLSFDPEIITNQCQSAKKKIYDPEIRLSRGEEVGIFNMGSTVIMVYPKTLPIDAGPIPRHVQMGAGVEV